MVKTNNLQIIIKEGKAALNAHVIQQVQYLMNM
jgi:hypothetical protein